MNWDRPVLESCSPVNIGNRPYCDNGEGLEDPVPYPLLSNRKVVLSFMSLVLMRGHVKKPKVESVLSVVLTNLTPLRWLKMPSSAIVG